MIGSYFFPRDTAPRQARDGGTHLVNSHRVGCFFLSSCSSLQHPSASAEAITVMTSGFFLGEALLSDLLYKRGTGAQRNEGQRIY